MHSESVRLLVDRCIGATLHINTIHPFEGDHDVKGCVELNTVSADLAPKAAARHIMDRPSFLTGTVCQRYRIVHVPFLLQFQTYSFSVTFPKNFHLYENATNRENNDSLFGSRQDGCR